MTVISVPLWVFIIGCIATGGMVLSILLFLAFTLIYHFSNRDDFELPREDNPDYNPEYIPKEEREKKHE